MEGNSPFNVMMVIKSMKMAVPLFVKYKMDLRVKEGLLEVSTDAGE